MVQKEIPDAQRAIIFQGGGALGAYEAGVLKEIYGKVKQGGDERQNKNHINLFNIVAGTSIGAINATVLVGHFLKNKNWEGSSEKLIADLSQSEIEPIVSSTTTISYEYRPNLENP